MHLADHKQHPSRGWIALTTRDDLAMPGRFPDQNLVGKYRRFGPGVRFVPRRRARCGRNEQHTEGKHRSRYEEGDQRPGGATAGSALGCEPHATNPQHP